MNTTVQSSQVPTAAMTEPEPPLSPARAFVVQFREGSGGQQEPFRGRVEHISSGQIFRFHSASELLDFLTQVSTTAADHERRPTSHTQTVE